MKKRTLRTIPRYLTLFSLVLLTLFGILFYYMTDMISQKRSLTYFEGLSAKSEQSVISYLEEIKRTANIVSYSRSIQEYLFESTAYRRVQAQQAASDLLSNIMSFSSNICEIAFVQRDGKIIQGNGEYTLLLRNAVEDFSLEPTDGKSPFFSPVIYNVSTQTDAHQPYFLFVYPIYSLIEGDFSTKPSATCLVLTKIKDLALRHIEGLDVKEATVTLMEGDRLIFSNRPLSDQEEKALSVVDYGGSVISFNGKNTFVFRRKLEETPWDVQIIAPEAELSRDLIPIKIVLVGFALIGIVFQILLLSFSTRQLSTPLQELVRKIQKIDLKEKKWARIASVQIEEIDLLGESINDMLDTIEQMEREQEENRRKLYQLSLLKKQAQLQYYRSQINPHFLYNTLECVSAMARVSGISCIESICTSMASLFRYSVGNSSIVTLRQEISHAEDYYNVIAQRMANRYVLKKNICPECWDMEIPKMILQPLLENSVQHGFEGKEENCVLLIQADIIEGSLHLIITDNGFGIPQVKLTQLKDRLQKSSEELNGAVAQNSSIGLLNINQRLQLIYAGKSRMEISSRYGYYTRIKIILPIE